MDIAVSCSNEIRLVHPGLAPGGPVRPYSTAAREPRGRRAAARRYRSSRASPTLLVMGQLEKQPAWPRSVLHACTKAKSRQPFKARLSSSLVRRCDINTSLKLKRPPFCAFLSRQESRASGRVLHACVFEIEKGFKMPRRPTCMYSSSNIIFERGDDGRDAQRGRGHRFYLAAVSLLNLSV